MRFTSIFKMFPNGETVVVYSGVLKRHVYTGMAQRAIPQSTADIGDTERNDK